MTQNTLNNNPHRLVAPCYAQAHSEYDSEDREETLNSLRRANLVALPYNVRGSAHFDGKLYQEQEKARLDAKRFIANASDKAFAFWEVFESVYGYYLGQDGWSGEIYYNESKTTFRKLVADLEYVLKLSKPKASAGFYEGQLARCLEGKQFQPIVRYLEQCDRKYPTDLPEWNQLAKVLLGVEDSLSQEMLTCWLVGAVNRALNPGCFMKRTLILKGVQDGGKSALVNYLGANWSSELRPGTSELDFVRLCTRSWIMELGECDKLFRGNDQSVIKQLLSTRVDKYVPKYKEADEMSITERVTVFIGTTNQSQFLVDTTGNKRYWVIDTGEEWYVPLKWLEANVEHIWATAYRQLRNGHGTDLSPESQAQSEARNKGYMVEGSWVEQLEDVLDTATKEGQRPIAFKAVDIMKAMGIKPENQGKNKAAILNSLKQLGYEQKPIKVKGKSHRLYCLKDADKPTPAKHDGNQWCYGDVD